MKPWEHFFKTRRREHLIWFVKLRNSEIISSMPNVKSVFGSDNECDEFRSNSFIIIRPVKLGAICLYPVESFQQQEMSKSLRAV
jgi:hypothetical protein